jgi:hypothetical protein
MTFSDGKTVTFESNFVLDLNDETKEAFKIASKNQSAAQNQFRNDVNCKLSFE